MGQIIGYTTEELANDIESLEPEMTGRRGIEVTLCSDRLPTDEELANFVLSAHQAGFVTSFPATGTVGGIPTTRFTMSKGAAQTGGGVPLGQWQLILPILVPLATIGIIAYGIVRVGDVSNALVPILLIGGGIAIVVIALLRRPAEKYIERGGKIPYLPSTEPIVENLTATSSKFVAVIDSGDTEFIPGSIVSPEALEKANARVIKLNLRPARVIEAPTGASEIDETGGRIFPDKDIMGFEPSTEDIIERIKEKNPRQYKSLQNFGSYSIIETADDLDFIIIYSTVPEGIFEIDANGDITKVGNEKQYVKNLTLQDLRASVSEERQARRTYLMRGKRSRVLGVINAAELFEHIAKEEGHHAEVFSDVFETEGGNPTYLPDSAEYLTETISACGYKDKLDNAFQEAITRARGS